MGKLKVFLLLGSILVLAAGAWLGILFNSNSKLSAGSRQEMNQAQEESTPAPGNRAVDYTESLDLGVSAGIDKPTGVKPKTTYDPSGYIRDKSTKEEANKDALASRSNGEIDCDTLGATDETKPLDAKAAAAELWKRCRPGRNKAVIGDFKPTLDIDLKEDETLTPAEKLKDATPKVGVEVTF